MPQPGYMLFTNFCERKSPHFVNHYVYFCYSVVKCQHFVALDSTPNMFWAVMRINKLPFCICLSFLRAPEPRKVPAPFQQVPRCALITSAICLPRTRPLCAGCSASAWGVRGAEEQDKVSLVVFLTQLFWVHCCFCL